MPRQKTIKEVEDLWGRNEGSRLYLSTQKAIASVARLSDEDLALIPPHRKQRFHDILCDLESAAERLKRRLLH